MEDYVSIIVFFLFLLIILDSFLDLGFTYYYVNFLTSKYGNATMFLLSMAWSVNNLLKWNKLDPIMKTKAVIVGICGLIFAILLVI